MKLALLIAAIFIFSACSSTDEINTSTAQGAYTLANKYEKDERFEEALAYYRDIKNKHPYSRYATESELRIAAIHFRRQSYPEAENAYKIFKEFHPRHKQIDFVTFRIGLSIFKQLPDSIDRDLTLANSAITYFEEVYTSYPNSDYAGSAKDHKIKCLQKLARKEYYIANFYFIREKYDSALSRFEGILKNYPKLGLDARTLYGAAYSSAELKDKEKARQYVNQLLKNFPGSKWADKAKDELRDYI